MMRDRLIELLQPSVTEVIENRKGITDIADYLLANGVIVSPCKVRDELLPCPFCGCDVQQHYGCKDEAIEAWNTRTPKERGGEKQWETNL